MEQKNKNDYTILIYGESGSGKSTSLRNLDLTKTAFINVEGKDLPFPNNNLKINVKPKTITEVKIEIKKAIDDESITTIVIDSITMLSDVMVYTELVKNAADSRGGWMELRDWMVGLIEYCKKTEKNFIFLALEMGVYNEREFITKTTPKIVGSLKDSLASHFTTVLRTVVREENDDIVYQFQTNRTKDSLNTVCKSPMKMLETYEPNDISLVVEKMERFYNE